MFRGPLFSRGAAVATLTWLGCTLTTDLPENSASSTASTTVTSGGGGAASTCATCTADCCLDRCRELGCPNCDGQDWASFCSDPTGLRGQCICAANTCVELVDCAVRECFDNRDCDTGECDMAAGLCAGAGGGSVASSSSAGASTNDCCFTHPEAGCADNPCENCVCFFEETCCTTAWDTLCVNTALDQCASSWCRCR